MVGSLASRTVSRTACPGIPGKSSKFQAARVVPVDPVHLCGSWEWATESAQAKLYTTDK